MISILLFTVGVLAAPSQSSGLTFQKLLSLPDPQGFAGCFAGTVEGGFLVAGGANFPDKKPWEGGTKVWYDTAYILDKPEGKWRKIGRLPRPLGYGVSVTTNRGVLCIGGSDAKRHYRECYLLRFKDGKLISEKLPSLPEKSANLCGVLVGKTVYVAGGIAKPDSTTCLKSFWKLDLSKSGSRWESLKPWPGPERMLATAATVDGWFYLFSGVSLSPDEEGKPVRTYLKDAYRYHPDKGWEKLPNMPRPAVACASPAPAIQKRILLLSGDDGSNVDVTVLSKHPGFPRTILEYDVKGKWTTHKEGPFSRVTLPSVSWRGRYLFPSGEVKPGIRSPEVWGLKIP